MRNTTLILLACLGLFLAACPPADETTTPDTAGEAVAEGEGHDHAHGEGEGHHGEGHPSPFHTEGIDAAVENLDNGVKMSFTSEDAETVAHIQEHMAKKAESGRSDASEGCGGDCPCGWEGVTKSVENLDNGLSVTLTTEDAETVPKLQEAIAAKAAEEGEEGGCSHGKSENAWDLLRADAVTRTAENLDNGVKILYTAGCPHLQGELKTAAAAKVEHMAAKKADGTHGDCPCHAEGVTITVEEIEGGTALVYTAEDAETVTKLQEFGAKKASGEGCGCGKHGEHAGHGHGDKGEGCGCGKHGEQADAPAEKADAA